MKSADKVAEEIANNAEFRLEADADDKIELEKVIAQALTAYAKERVASLRSPCTDGELHQACQCLTEYIGNVRAEALEEGIQIGMKRQSAETSESVIRRVKAEALEEAAKIADKIAHDAGNESVDASQPYLTLVNERMRIALYLSSTIRTLKTEV